MWGTLEATVRTDFYGGIRGAVAPRVQIHTVHILVSSPLGQVGPGFLASFPSRVS